MKTEITVFDLIENSYRSNGQYLFTANEKLELLAAFVQKPNSPRFGRLKKNSPPTSKPGAVAWNCIMRELPCALWRYAPIRRGDPITISKFIAWAKYHQTFLNCFATTPFEFGLWDWNHDRGRWIARAIEVYPAVWRMRELERLGQYRLIDRGEK